MAKRTPAIEITSFGIYSQWDAKSKQLPKITQFTTDVPADESIEFGFTVNIKRAKGLVLDYCIDHPGILNKKGLVMAPFDGDIHINSNDWDFYLGDTIQLKCPDGGLESNLGPWRMTMTLQSKIIAEKTFHVYPRDEAGFWKRRGY
ncbi:DUF3859 domain-containing protein [Vibrio sonorensis]|uniref:DUF3859 domain-containing protein n=1 Tax=Vibrio sonorensis TaxID=1004316 RepID=UPI0008D90A6C|nr:DUF3859 domain-containing protein [Vibrio sonorensis]